MAPVSVLFASSQTVYRTFQVDVWDAARNARLWPGGNPAIAHPPCAQWSRLRAFSKPDEIQKSHAPWAIEQIRNNKGIVEHPESSTLWKYMNLPEPGQRDKWGWTLQLQQRDWGHTTRKNTRLYIVGIEPHQLPRIPLRMGTSNKNLQLLDRKARSATPWLFAAWLIIACRAITP